MANLDRTNMLKYDEVRPAVFLEKCKKGESHRLEKKPGGPIIITRVEIGDKTFDMKKGNRTTLQSLYNAFNTTLANKWRIFISDDEDVVSYAFGDLMKDDDYKDGAVFNKGNIAEGIFASAICLRFTNKNRALPVTEQQIKDFITKLPANKNIGQVDFQSPNKDVDIKDDVHFIYGLSQNNYDAMKKREYWPQFANLFRASCAYANSLTVKNWAQLVYENNLYNEIFVLADGESDQTGTKVDIRLKINDHDGKALPVNINISLKAGDVKQFGQLGGTKHEIQEKLWKQFFDIDKLPLTKKEFDNLKGTKFHHKDAAVAIRTMYEKIAPTVQEQMKKEHVHKIFGKAIQYHATRGEEFVELIQLTTAGDVVIYNFDKIDEALKGADIEVEVKYSQAKVKGQENLPIMMFYVKDTDNKKNELLQIRVKRGEKTADGTPYYRNIVEKKKYMTQLLARELV